MPPAFEGGRDSTCPRTPVRDGSHFESDALVLMQPIRLSGDRIGSVYLRSVLHELDHASRTTPASVILVVVAAACQLA